MTLGELAGFTGVSAEEILRDLGVPEDVPAEERLGRLRRTYGFSMDELREVVKEPRRDGGVLPKRSSKGDGEHPVPRKAGR
jgi:hypothetical protein